MTRTRNMQLAIAVNVAFGVLWLVIDEPICAALSFAIAALFVWGIPEGEA